MRRLAIEYPEIHRQFMNGNFDVKLKKMILTEYHPT